MTLPIPTAWRWRLLLACLLGVVIALLSYTLFLTEAWAYLSNDPSACANCHLMEEPVSSWTASSHHADALCNDCHAPQTLAVRQISQAANGIRHGWSFTFGAGRTAHRLREGSLVVLERNCLRCHAALVEALAPGSRRARDRSCTRCHRTVGHG